MKILQVWAGARYSKPVLLERSLEDPVAENRIKLHLTQFYLQILIKESDLKIQPILSIYICIKGVKWPHNVQGFLCKLWLLCLVLSKDLYAKF